MDPRAAKEFILEKLRRELPKERTYHSLAHTLDVYASAIDIAEKEGVTGEGLELLKTAALFHDVGFIVQDREHEVGSCDLAREHLPRFGYTPAQVEHICTMIMATKIPQEPHDALSRILCDADLDYLGRNDFFRIGDKLCEELRCYGVLSEVRQWNELQLVFLETHRYFTATNKRDREPVKKENLERVRKWLEGEG